MDFVIETTAGLVAIEVKLSATPRPAMAADRFVRKKGIDILMKAIPEVLAGDRRMQFQIA